MSTHGNWSVILRFNGIQKRVTRLIKKGKRLQDKIGEIRIFYVVHSISFQTFFVQAFKVVVDSWKSVMLLLYILWDDWPIFMISGSNEQLQQQLEYTLLKPDCHSWWISKMQSGREDTLEEWYAIEFCFKLEKMPQKCMECFRLLFEHLAWITLIESGDVMNISFWVA